VGAGWREGIDQVKRLAVLDPERDVAAFVRSEELDHIRACNLSKEALIPWTFAETEALIELDIRINALSPSAVDTAILDDCVRAFGYKMQRNHQRAGRSGYPHEVAEVAAFFDHAEAELLAVVSDDAHLKVVGYLTESCARRRHAEELDQATQGIV
jgi:NAD(P)-dependent dehydrogenase (short-subunit alcohol dehydrogenase family)